MLYWQLLFLWFRHDNRFRWWSLVSCVAAALEWELFSNLPRSCKSWQRHCITRACCINRINVGSTAYCDRIVWDFPDYPDIKNCVAFGTWDINQNIILILIQVESTVPWRGILMLSCITCFVLSLLDAYNVHLIHELWLLRGSSRRSRTFWMSDTGEGIGVWIRLLEYK